MPIYEYHCEKCGRTFEKMQSFDSEHQCECPECGEEAKRIISQSSFHLKGTGWYTSDYKNAGCSAKSDSPACKSCAHAEK